MFICKKCSLEQDIAQRFGNTYICRSCNAESLRLARERRGQPKPEPQELSDIDMSFYKEKLLKSIKSQNFEGAVWAILAQQVIALESGTTSIGAYNLVKDILAILWEVKRTPKQTDDLQALKELLEKKPSRVQ